MDERIALLEQRVATLDERVAQLERRSIPVAPPVAPVRSRATEAATALETTLGTYWLSRIGIVSLITGAALLIITYFGELGAVLRVALGYAMAGALAWGGLRLARRHDDVRPRRVRRRARDRLLRDLRAALRPRDADRRQRALGVALVAAAIAGIVDVAHRMQSETVAGIALFLGLHTGMLSDVTALSLRVHDAARRRRRLLPGRQPLGHRPAVDRGRGLLDPRDAGDPRRA